MFRGLPGIPSVFRGEGCLVISRTVETFLLREESFRRRVASAHFPHLEIFPIGANRRQSVASRCLWGRFLRFSPSRFERFRLIGIENLSRLRIRRFARIHLPATNRPGFLLISHRIRLLGVLIGIVVRNVPTWYEILPTRKFPKSLCGNSRIRDGR